MKFKIRHWAVLLYDEDKDECKVETFYTRKEAENYYKNVTLKKNQWLEFVKQNAMNVTTVKERHYEQKNDDTK